MKSVLRTSISTNLSAATGAVILAFMSACSGAEVTELSIDSSEAADSAPRVAESTDRSTAVSATEQPLTTRARRASSTSKTSAGAEDVNEPSSVATEAEQSEPTLDEPEASAPVPSSTLRVVGNQLLDTCGQPFVVRGVEQILGEQLPVGNDWLGLVREIAATGANAVRVLPGVNTLTTDDVDQILSFIGSEGMVAFIDPLNSEGDWYARDDVKAMLKKHESYLIIDAYGEPQYDDVEKWRAEAKEALVRMRELGYTVPFTVYANQFGRGLPSLFDYGAEILAADPLHNTFLGWQAYWGQGGYYQEHYGYSLSEAVEAIVDSGLPIQMGLDHVTDLPSETADYGTLMRGAEENGIGWLWWDFYNPYGSENNLSEDGSADNLTATGSSVLATHEASVSNTARLACTR